MNLDKRVVGLIAVLAIVLVLILVFARKPESTPTPAPTEDEIDLTKTSPELRVAKQDFNKVLAGFPEDFPLEEGVQGQGSGYKLVPANSQELQSTVEYVSQKSLGENAKLFKDYLISREYKITNELKEATLVFYYATKDNNDLSIRIEQKNGQVTVSASYLKR